MVSLIEKPLHSDAQLIEAIRAIEATSRRTAVVVDRDRKLIGTLTDGDVRRALLAGADLDTKVSQAMNRNPTYAHVNDPGSSLFDLMKSKNIVAIPLVDDSGYFVRLVHLYDLAPGERNFSEAGFSFALIMAGGEGKRLRPITARLPKPMVEIGGIPLLERQVNRLAGAGLTSVYISVNYMSNVIENHFGSGERFGLRITYLRESEKLGTGGALKLLTERPKSPFVVMNGDIVTTCSFKSLADFHRDHDVALTVAAIDYRINIPFGVLSTKGAFVTNVIEKPSQRFLCNAGVYALSPQVLDYLPNEVAFDMTDLIKEVLTRRYPVAVFPMHEYWSDIGTPADLERVQDLFRSGYE